MGYSTSTTKTTSTTSAKSKQAVTYQYPDGDGVVLTGSAITQSTTTYIDVVTPGGTRTFSAVTGGGVTGATITSLNYLDANNLQTNASAVSTGGGNVLVNGTGFTSNTRIYIDDQLVSSSFVNANAIIAIIPSHAVGNSLLAVFNSSNTGGALSNSYIRYSGAPSWTGGSTFSGVNGISSNNALTATGDGPLTYSLKSGSGSLPTGITLNSAGFLSGTPTGYTAATTAVTFTLIVTDTEGQAAQRDFTFTIVSGDPYYERVSLLLSADTANTFITDYSANNFLLTPVGDVQPSRLTPYWPGGWSGYFSGSSDYLTIPAFTGVGAWTLEFWIYQLVGSPGDVPIISQGQADGTANFLVWMTNTRTLHFYSNGYICSTSNVVPVGKWTHIAYVSNASNSITIYIDGVSSATGTYSGKTFDGTPLQVNRGYGGVLAGTSFYMSNLRLVKGNSLYTSNFTPSSNSLPVIANTSMLILRDQSLVDDSPNNYAITRTGTVRLTEFSPFNSTPHTITANSSSVYFDGNGDFLSLPTGSTWDFGTANFTIEFWIYPSGSSGAYARFFQTANGDVFAGIGMSRNNTADGLALFLSSNGTSYDIINGSATTYDLNTWTHFALVRNGTGFTLYKNGVSVVTATSSAAIYYSAAHVPVIGGQTGGRFYAGYLSNFRIVKGTAVYTSNFTPPTTPLTAIANTSLLTCQSSTLIDNSTNNFTITGNGDATPIAANPFGETISTINNYSYSANLYSGSAYFDGASDYMTIPANAGFQFGTGNFTIEFWLNYASLTNFQTIIASGYVAGVVAGGWIVQTGNGDGKVNFYYQSAGSASLIASDAGSTVLTNTWYHIAIVRSGSTVTIYRNGQRVGSGTDSNNYNANSNVVIGGGSNTGFNNYWVNGYISNLRILKGTALYRASFIPPTSPLTAVANTSLLTLQSDVSHNSNQFVDQGPHNFVLSRNGNVSQSSYTPLAPTGWSGYFDATGDYLTIADNAALQVASSNFTFECWVYPKSLPGGANLRGVFSKRVNSATYGGLVLYWYSNGVILVLAASSASTWGLLEVSTGHSISLNTWQHLALVRNGNNLILYKDGVAGTTLTLNFNVYDSAGSFAIGSTDAAGTGAFDGYISNFRLVKGTAVYTSAFTPSTTPLSSIANTSLLTLRTTSFIDESPNNFTITRNGDTYIQPFGPFKPYKITPNDFSVFFDGTGDFLTLPDNAALEPGSSDLTWEMWINTTSSTQYATIYSRTPSTFASGMWSLMINVASATAGDVGLYVGNFNTVSPLLQTTGVNVRDGTWHHIAVVRNGSAWTLYVDGVSRATATWAGTIADIAGGPYIGRDQFYTRDYVGSISNLRILKGTALYTSGFTPPTASLTAIANTSLLTCKSSSVVDNSNNSFTITTNGDARVVTANPFYTAETATGALAYNPITDGGSAYFDGTGDSITFPFVDQMTFPGDFTIEAWVYPRSLNASYAGIIETRATAATSANWTFGLRNSTGYKIDFLAVSAYTGTTTIGLNQWTHVAVSRQGSTTRLFVNGKLDFSTTSITGTITPAGTTGRIGTVLDSGTDFPGYISNLRVVKGTALYTTAFTPDSFAPRSNVANTVLLTTFTNGGIIDSSYKNTFESFGNVSVTSSVKKYATSSYYFDGNGDYLLTKDLINNERFAFGTGDFTIEMWIYFNSTSTAVFYDQRPASTNGLYPTLYIGTSALLRYFVNSVDVITGTTTITTGQWYHLALARSGSSTKMFLNGNQEGSTYTDSNNYLSGASRPVIGSPGFTIGSSWFSGYIADLRITKGYARYAANFTVPAEALLEL